MKESITAPVVRTMKELGYTVMVADKNYASERNYASKMLLCQHEYRRNMIIFVFYDGLILLRCTLVRELTSRTPRNLLDFFKKFRGWFAKFAERTYHSGTWTINSIHDNTVSIQVELPLHAFDREIFLELYHKFHEEVENGECAIDRWVNI